MLIVDVCLNHLHVQNSFDHGQFVNLSSKISVLTTVKNVCQRVYPPPPPALLTLLT